MTARNPSSAVPSVEGPMRLLYFSARGIGKNHVAQVSDLSRIPQTRGETKSNPEFDLASPKISGLPSGYD